MASHSEQHYDDVAKKVFKTSGLESPSLDFTAKVMSKLEQDTVVEYKPVISKLGWFVIAAAIIGIVVYPLFGDGESIGILENVDYSVITDNKITDVISSISFSNTLMYCIVILGAFLFIQVNLMKQQIDKRLEF